MNKDIKALIAIYTVLILAGWNIGISYKSNKQINQLKKEVLEVKKIAVEIINEKNEYIFILQEAREQLNDEIDLLNGELKQCDSIKKLKKDLR